MIFDRMGQEWRKSMAGLDAALLLPDQDGKSWDVLPPRVSLQVRRAVSRARPGYQRLSHRPHQDGASAYALILPVGQHEVDRLLIAAYAMSSLSAVA